MPIRWGADHRARLVVITATGVLRRTDMEDCFQSVNLAATMSYRKIFDMTECSPALDKEDVVAFGERVRARAKVSAIGALAIVATSGESYRLARLIESSTVAERPVKVFKEFAAAQNWLEAGPTEAVQPTPGEWPVDYPDRSEGSRPRE